MALAGCPGTTKFSGSAVALTITPDGPSAPNVRDLEITVSGADNAVLHLPAGADFAQGAPAQLLYRALAASGTLDFTVTASAFGTPLAMGTGSIALQPRGTVPLAIPLAPVPGPDFGPPPDDLGPPPDFTLGPPDLSGAPPPADFAGLDLFHGPIVPSNATVPYDPGAADLSGVVAIDTSALQIAVVAGPGADGGVLGPPPAGIGFVKDGSVAVLTVGTWTVDQEVKVTGTLPLIVVATKVDVKNVIHLEAHGATPGPGGFGPAAGPGKGGNGFQGSFGGIFLTYSGGGGAGHGSVGASGGPAYNAVGGPGGPAYGAALDLAGGSGGGSGAVGCGLGGAGGGAIQISANDSIVVEFYGAINAGGGGSQLATCSGAGSGGTILLEARAITVRGVLAANGGGVNSDAILGNASAGTGPGSGASVLQAARVGQSILFSGYGGGGGVGRITLRTSAPELADYGSASAISPAPAIDQTLP